MGGFNINEDIERVRCHHYHCVGACGTITKNDASFICFLFFYVAVIVCRTICHYPEDPLGVGAKLVYN